MSYVFQRGRYSTDRTVLVGIGDDKSSYYVGSYFPVFHDSECPWRVSIRHGYSDRWTVLPTKDETTAQKLLIAAWACMEGEYTKPPKGERNGKIV